MKRLAIFVLLLVASTISAGCSTDSSEELAALKLQIEALQAKETERASTIDSLSKQLATLTSRNEALSKTVDETAGVINSLKLERTPNGKIVIDSLVVRELVVMHGETVRATMVGTHEGCVLIMKSPDNSGGLSLACTDSYCSVATSRGNLELIQSCRDELAGFVAKRDDTTRLLAGVWRDDATSIVITDANGDVLHEIPPSP